MRNFMLYFVMILMIMIPVLMLLSALEELKNIDRKDTVRYQSDLVHEYSACRTRGSVRQGMNRVKNAEDYYIIEKRISFPQK